MSDPQWGKRFLASEGGGKSFASRPGTVHDRRVMSDSSPLIVAIDGPAASGKSTVARRIAAELGCVFVNSGAMYRAFTWWVLESGVDTADTPAVLKLLGETEFECAEEDRVGTISVGGRRMTRAELSDPAVNGNVSAIAAIPEVRERLVAEQRLYATRQSVVMEGRDIGSVVFPETPFKFYIDASPEVRAERRRAEGIDDEIIERDRIDSSRKASPLVIADQAIVIDSSHLGIDEVVAQVVAVIRGTD
jgi:cytidylate kinase